MKILVVDDHQPTLDLMHMALTNSGHVVSSTTSVMAAIEMALEAPPDIVLSDLTFQTDMTAEVEGDGHALARSLRSIPRTKAVGLLAVTGLTSASERRAASDAGFDGLVVKPFDVRLLLEQVDELGRVVANRIQHEIDGA